MFDPPRSNFNCICSFSFCCCCSSSSSFFFRLLLGETVGSCNNLIWAFLSCFFLFPDTSLIIFTKGVGTVTNITFASFNPKYKYNFSEAVRVCEILNGALATREQMQAAWDEGFQQCKWVCGLTKKGKVFFICLKIFIVRMPKKLIN